MSLPETEPAGASWRAGLSQADAQVRLQAEGFNELPMGDGRGILRIVVDVLREPMFSLLLAAGAIYLVLGDLGEAIVLLAFATLSVLITVVQETRSERVLAALRDQASPRALVIRDGERRRIPGREVVRGDTIVVLEGDRIPADAVVVSAGSLVVDESLLTGEPLPVSKDVGAALTGGAINGEGRIVMQVKAVGAETVLARIIRLVEDAQAAKAPIQRLVDQVSAVFVPVVVVVSVITLLAWYLTGHPFELAVIHAVAVLVIACPCALGLATPAAIMAGTGVAAKFGILIKDAQALELAHKVDTVAFDKTGTLTVGRPRLTALLLAGEPWSASASQSVSASPSANAPRLGDSAAHQAVLAAAASLQSGSEHPLARAVVALAQERGLPIAPPNNVRAVPGRGTEGEVGAIRYFVGSLPWLQERQVSLGDLAGAATHLQAQGATVSAMVENSSDGLHLRALLAFGDEPKPGAKEALAGLRQRGLRLVMISGDNRGAAEAMARRLGLRPEDGEVMAEVLPGDKAARVMALKAGGHVVAMVGDGVNDAPALAAADVGLAMSNPGGGGTDVAMHAAGITLMRGDPALVAGALDISDRTVAKIRQNLFWAFAYNVAGIPLAALGFLNPVVAGAAMALSSVSVMSNALLLKRWKPGK